MTKTQRRYKLIDGIDRNRLHPSTFEIPSPSNKALLVIGDYVKLGFVPLTKKNVGERMWVKISSLRSNSILGTLANDPVDMPLIFGEIVEFKNSHILDILPARISINSSNLGR